MAERSLAAAGGAGRLSSTWLDYLSLTKPRVVSLLLLITAAAMVAAKPVGLSPQVVLSTLLGGYLAAGGAGALNCYLDCDIDAVMARTRRRPLPARRLPRRNALLFGLALGLLSFAVLWLGANALAAWLALAGLLFYVVVYTAWLKRRTTQNIVIGGAAGAVPCLVGWAAATGSLSVPPLLMFAMVCLWTPPHFWALALTRREDYARAGVPMLPVVQGEQATRVQILLYVAVLVAASLSLSLIGFAGAVYLAAAVALGAWLVWQSVGLFRGPGAPGAWRLYRFSLAYLALIFLALAVDRLIWH